jgi:hypothetical protein
MKAIKLGGATISFLALALLCCNAYPFGQKNRNRLLDKQLTVQFTNATLKYVLNTLAQDYGVPIGLEIASTHRDEYNLNVNIEDGRLRDILDSIVQQYPAYEWEEKDGVINFTPTHDRYEYIAKLLYEPIKYYEPIKENGKNEISDSIFKLPEVSSFMDANGGKAEDGAIFLYKPSVIYDDGATDLSISNTNVRGILNKIVKDCKHKMWIIDMVGKNNDILDITFLY